MNAKCPHCEKMLTAVTVNDLQGQVNLQPVWRCLGYSCQWCQKLLSVQMNPNTLNNDLVADLVKALRQP